MKTVLSASGMGLDQIPKDLMQEQFYLMMNTIMLMFILVITVHLIAYVLFVMKKEFARKSGIAANIPEATLKVIRDTTDEFVKATSMQNQIALATIDATQQNIKTFNDNAKSFADLNKNVLQSWISAFTAHNN